MAASWSSEPPYDSAAARASMASADATSHIQHLSTPLACQTLVHMHDTRQAGAYGEQRGV
jgi:hypothetical protein